MASCSRVTGVACGFDADKHPCLYVLKMKTKREAYLVEHTRFADARLSTALVLEKVGENENDSKERRAGLHCDRQWSREMCSWNWLSQVDRRRLKSLTHFSSCVRSYKRRVLQSGQSVCASADPSFPGCTDVVRSANFMLTSIVVVHLFLQMKGIQGKQSDNPRNSTRGAFFHLVNLESWTKGTSSALPVQNYHWVFVPWSQFNKPFKRKQRKHNFLCHRNFPIVPRDIVSILSYSKVPVVSLQSFHIQSLSPNISHWPP